MVCVIKNTATLAGSLFTLHCSQIHIDLPTLSDEDKEVRNSFQNSDMYLLMYLYLMSSFMELSKMLYIFPFGAPYSKSVLYGIK